MKELFQYQNLPKETEARWRPVETAWSLNMNPSLSEVKQDNNTNVLFISPRPNKRINITSSRDALNGYQEGKCFYTSVDISIANGASNLADVDHFSPHKLEPYLPGINLDGVWNLVLAAKESNRSNGGKFARVPSRQDLMRLNARNNYLIDSHHPLKDTIIKQTGNTERERIRFLERVFDDARKYLNVEATFRI